MGRRGERAPVVWLLGGLDPTGGAGILRDLWSARAVLPSARVGAVVSAWTWQGGGAKARSEARPRAKIVAELAALPRPDAVKVGLLPAQLLVEGVGEALIAAARGAPIVVDPVLVASDGGDLGAGVGRLRDLTSAVTLVTPNVPEARALVGEGEREEGGAAPEFGGLLERLAAIHPRRGAGTAWLLKGGHAPADDRDRVVIDHLWADGRLSAYRRPRQPGPDPRGTGCALATAIACSLARGRSLEDSVGEAIAWLDRARLAWRRGRDGRPHLPVAPAPPGV
ncbi:MAG: bifunctional hydroxymethylpyrimidine kinase/phosphomethylpyrimidine kinase [Myxococcales bacterium]|nr:bifunctional hydroxymethylpyrimidine kinase/phosphomethylpyrimidine kinase [Myxococcales bacterium]